jgi:RNA polymerase sigma factor (sigma-70 family)
MGSDIEGRSVDPQVAVEQIELVEGRSADPQVAVERQERIDALLDALARLPDRERTVLVLKYFDDLPNVEIAERLGITPNYVGVLLHRGKAGLRKDRCLREYLTEM